MANSTKEKHQKKILPKREVGKCIGCGKKLLTWYTGANKHLYENVPYLFCEECLNTDEPLY